MSLFSMEKIIVRGISFSTFFTELARDFLFCKRRFSREYPIAIAIGMQTNADAGWQDERRRWPRTVATLGGALVTIIVLAAARGSCAGNFAHGAGSSTAAGGESLILTPVRLFTGEEVRSYSIRPPVPYVGRLRAARDHRKSLFGRGRGVAGCCPSRVARGVRGVEGSSFVVEVWHQRLRQDPPRRRQDPRPTPSQ